MNALFSYDEENDKLTFLTSFQKEQKKKYLYYKAFLYRDEAWFIPYMANYIAIVNLEKKSIEYIPVIFNKEYEYTFVKYINILYFKENFLCLVPQDVDAAIIIDLKNKKIKPYYNIASGKKTYPYHSAVFYDEKIYFFPWMEQNILVLDLKTNERVYLPWNKKPGAFRDAIYNQRSGCLFHSPANDNYILVDDLLGRQHKYIKCGDWKDWKYRTCYASESKNELFFWGHEKDIVIKINKNDYKVTVYQIDHKSAGIYFFPIESDDIEALVFEGNCIIRYDKEKDIFFNIYISTTWRDFIREIKQSDVGFEDIMEPYKNAVTMENNKMKLPQFIFYASDIKKTEYHRKKTDIGYTIYKYF